MSDWMGFWVYWKRTGVRRNKEMGLEGGWSSSYSVSVFRVSSASRITAELSRRRSHRRHRMVWSSLVV